MSCYRNFNCLTPNLPQFSPLPNSVLTAACNCSFVVSGRAFSMVCRFKQNTLNTFWNSSLNISNSLKKDLQLRNDLTPEKFSERFNLSCKKNKSKRIVKIFNGKKLRFFFSPITNSVKIKINFCTKFREIF